MSFDLCWSFACTLERVWLVLEAERVVKQVRIMYRLGVVPTLGLAIACGGGSSTNRDAGVAIDAAAPKAITSFAFLAVNNSGLATDVTATISGTTISAALRFADVTALKATFTTTGATVEVGGASQSSGVTSDDFTNPVTYTVTAADGSTVSYVVTVADASFSAEVEFATTGIGPDSVAIGDFNSDGKPDIAVANFESSSISVLLNTTAAEATMPSFAPKVDFTTGTTVPFGVAVGDRPTYNAIHVAYLLSSTISSVAAAGARLIVFCSP